MKIELMINTNNNSISIAFCEISLSHLYLFRIILFFII